jgi:lipopolysaccharide/colanic/teichoic acid biosynthesis glycosyltransferase
LDFSASLVGLLLLFPLFLLVAFLVKVTSRGPVFYTQIRVGQQFKPFTIIKFRSMVLNNSDVNTLVTSTKDDRITPLGTLLRRYKLDELPQLINVLKGDMSLVGPRPEVQRYIRHFQLDYAGILRVKPGITDTAAIAFKHEEALLAEHEDVEWAYVNVILPQKIKMYHDYIKGISFWGDIKLIFRTLF